MRGAPILAMRVQPIVRRRLREHAERRGLTVTDYVTPMLRYLASVDEDDPVWGQLDFMRLPKVERVPRAGNG